jgi:hypothetical protein
VELHIFIEGFNPGLILPMELKNRGLKGTGKCKLKGNTIISLNPAPLKHSSAIFGGFSWKISKKSE